MKNAYSLVEACRRILDIKKSNLGQSYIIQFILFFMVGIGLFVGIGSFFRTQYNIIREDTADISVEMTNNYLSSLAVTSVCSCLKCGAVETNFDIEDTTAGHVLEILLNESGMVISTLPSGSGHISNMKGLNNSLESLSGSANSMKKINLTYDRKHDGLEMAPSKYYASITTSTTTVQEVVLPFDVELNGDYDGGDEYSSITIEGADIGDACSSGCSNRCNWYTGLSTTINTANYCEDGRLVVTFTDSPEVNYDCNANHRACIDDGSVHCCSNQCSGYGCTNSVTFDCDDWSCI